jgi:hypothetical protein
MSRVINHAEAEGRIGVMEYWNDEMKIILLLLIFSNTPVLQFSITPIINKRHTDCTIQGGLGAGDFIEFP